MEKLLVPEKTYRMYVEGHRTFIHTGKENEGLLKELKYGEDLCIVNKENENEFII